MPIPIPARALVLATVLGAGAAAACGSAGVSGPLPFATSGLDAWPAVADPVDVLLSPECEIPGLEVRPAHQGSWAPAPVEVRGRQQLAQSEGTDLVLNTAGGPAAFLAGVNLGPTIPGFQPGEVAIRREDFRRWFPMMAEQGFRVIRIYSIQPPSFYEELRDHNLANPDDPLYLVHGAWIPEERFVTERDLFGPGLQEEYFTQIDDVLTAVFGTGALPARLGHAEGVYTADVSPWVQAWVIGVEWDPAATNDTNRINAGREPFVGTHFRSIEGASPVETWIAGAMDHLAAGLWERGTSAPIGFVNWPTTDPLDHPDEPLTSEDLVNVDANHVQPVDWPAGTFASYHAYPYYPDFQRYEAGIVDCEYRGELSSYAGYLAKLRRHHADMPVLITEFGVPTGWAHAHYGPQGRDQGNHSDQDAMRINAEMMATIHDLGFSGGYVFEWVDEWFKFTWNTIDYELPPNRRQLWMNPWTNEAHFGVVAVEPGTERIVTIDGSTDEWSDNGAQVISEAGAGVREIRAIKDEGYLYLAITLDEPFDDRTRPLIIGFDVLAAEGGGLPGTDGVHPEADYAAVLTPNGAALTPNGAALTPNGAALTPNGAALTPNGAALTPNGAALTPDAGGQVLVAGHADAYRRTYGLGRGYFDVDPTSVEPGSGAWEEHWLITNRPLTIPSTGRQFDVETVNAGLLRRGHTDPELDGFDSRHAWEADGNTVEIRLPFMAIGISDPSQRLAFAVNDQGETRAEPFDRIGIVIASGTDAFVTSGYSWEPWQMPSWHERVKTGADLLTATNRRLQDGVAS